MFTWCLIPLMSEAQVNFTFTYPEPSMGPANLLNAGDAIATARRSAIASAAAKYASAFANYDANVVVEAIGYSSPGSGTLASAGTYFVSGNPGFGEAETTRKKIVSNGTVDRTGSSADAILYVNFGKNWEFDHDATVSGTEFDWHSVIYHEFTHMVGFASGIQTDGGTNARDLFENTTNGNWAAFDKFLTDSSMTASVFTDFNLNTGVYESLLSGPSAGLYFNSTDEGLLPLYSPASYAAGSSGSHLDTSFTGQMMRPFIPQGVQGAREFSDEEMAILKDIGYTDILQINAVPEPKHVVLGLGGIAFIAVLARRRILRNREN